MLAAYILSPGPVRFIMEQTGSGIGPLEYAFFPLDWAYGSSDSVEAFYDWWIELWIGPDP